MARKREGHDRPVHDYTGGNTVDCQILKPVEYMNEETLRWLSQQRWTPVTFRGESVEVSYVFQLAFRHGVAPQRNGGW
jgi:hypothetical protein